MPEATEFQPNSRSAAGPRLTGGRTGARREKTMADYTLTVTVPPTLYDQLKDRAERMHRRIEDEIVLALAATLPAEASLPVDLAATLASLTALDDDTLWRLATSRVSDADAARLAELADKRQRAGLAGEELREAEELAQRHDRVLVVRAEAAALLKQRGHDVSALAPKG
jgi:hypothetical protein